MLAPLCDSVSAVEARGELPTELGVVDVLGATRTASWFVALALAARAQVHGREQHEQIRARPGHAPSDSIPTHSGV